MTLLIGIYYDIWHIQCVLIWYLWLWLMMWVRYLDNSRYMFHFCVLIWYVWLLDGGLNPSETYESQLGWWNSQLNGKTKQMFQTTNQTMIYWWCGLDIEITLGIEKTWVWGDWASFPNGKSTVTGEPIVNL